MTNRLIKDDLLNNYSHRIYEYFEKKCKIKQCFRCQKYDHVNKACRNDDKCDFCACEHSSFECRTFNEHKKCVNCVDKHSAWSFQCDVKAKKKQRLDTIWNNKSLMHFETSTDEEAASTEKRFYVIEITQMRSLATSQQAMKLSTQQSTQYDFTMMSLDLNENINRFFVLFSTHDKRSHSQKSSVESSTTFRRLINVVQINSSQNDINVLAILRYKFKSFFRLKRFLKKFSQSSNQNNSIIQNTQNENEWWHNHFYSYCSITFEITKTTSWFSCSRIRRYEITTFWRFKNLDATHAFSRRITRLSSIFI